MVLEEFVTFVTTHIEESQSQTYTVFRNVTDEAIALLTSKEKDNMLILNKSVDR
jgi:hypothetical protein